MNIVETREAGAVVLALSGDLDVRGARTLRRELDRCLAAGERRFVVDFASVSAASAEGLRVILGLTQTLAASGGVALCGLSAPIVELIEVSGLSNRFEVAPSRALAAKKIPVPKSERSKTTALLARLLGAPAAGTPRRRAARPSAVTRAVRAALFFPGSPLA